MTHVLKQLTNTLFSVLTTLMQKMVMQFSFSLNTISEESRHSVLYDRLKLKENKRVNLT